MKGKIEYFSYRSSRLLGNRVHSVVQRCLRRSPYKRFNDQHSCIFVHVPKAAGTSVARALFGAQPGHTTAHYYQYYDSQKFEDYFKFTFVRNPWDRLVSAYSYLRQGRGWPVDRYFASKYLANVSNFSDFVGLIYSSKHSSELRDWLHFRPQTEFVCDRSGNAMVDFVGRYERLSEDFSHIRDRLRIDCRLEALNMSDRPEYRTFYDDASTEKVAEIYRSDIAVFGYSF